MSARDEILRAVRAARPAASPLPDVGGFSWPAGDLAVRFAEAARAAGAQVVKAGSEGVQSAVRQAYPDVLSIVSRVPELFPGTEPFPTEPHPLANVDLFVCEAVLGVAENGAVWLPESRLGLRAAPFLAAHVAVLLKRDATVADLHDAYTEVDAAGESFGVFVAGPSKTADIEQSLVIGAHGPKSLTLVLLT